MPDRVPATGRGGRLAVLLAAGLAGGFLIGAGPDARDRAPAFQEEWDPALPEADTVWHSSETCVRCHQIDPTFSHPVNFVPSRTLGADFPLENGVFTCTTCHAVGPRHRMRRGQPHTRLGLTGTALCAECHDQTNLSRADMHAFVLAIAHTRLPNQSHEPEAPDFKSTSCLTCHDGSLVTSISHRRSGGADFSSGTHPFGVDYRLEDPEAFDGPLMPASSLDHRIRLSEGRMDCGSCHSLYSPLDNLVVMENRGSALCLSCHQY